MPPPRQGGDSAVVCPLRYIRNLDDLLRGAQSKNLILRSVTKLSVRTNRIFTFTSVLYSRPSQQRFHAASMCGFVLSSRWVGVGSHGGFTAACAVLRLVSHMPLARFSFMRLSRLGGLRHWTSTAQEERVVMIVLGFTITLNRFGKVRERVMHTDALGGLA